MLFKELEFPLKEIGRILDSDNFDRELAIEQQIHLLTLKKQRMEKLILHAKQIQLGGTKFMSFEAFDHTEIDEYAKKAKEKWGDTDAYKEFQEKTKGKDSDFFLGLKAGLMQIFAEFGALRKEEPTSQLVQQQVFKLQSYITEHYYLCTNDILQGLGQMYESDDKFRENIDTVGGTGCACFVASAIKAFVKK